MMKKIFLIMMFVLFSSFVFATPTQINTPYDVWAQITNVSIPIDVDNTTLTILYPNGSTFVSDYNMSFISTGLYKYTFTPAVLGNWYLEAHFNKNNVVVGTSSDNLEVLQNYVGGGSGTLNTSPYLNNSFSSLNSCPNSSSQMLLFLGLAFALMLVFAWGYAQRSILFMLTCGLFFIGLSLMLWSCLAFFGVITLAFGMLMIPIAFIRGRHI
jgi:hypothetical protein